MLDSQTKEVLREIALCEENKPKDRVSASKLLLTLGLYTEEILSLLHAFVEDLDFPAGMKVKAVELLDKYETKVVETKVEDTSELEKEMMENYNI